MQFYNMAYIFLLLSSMYSPPFPHPHRYKHEQYGCCHKKQLIEIYPIWQSRFKKIPRKSNHNREWSCMTLSFAVPCQHIRIKIRESKMKRKRFSRVDWQVSLLLSILLVYLEFHFFNQQPYLLLFYFRQSYASRRKYAQLCGTRTDARSILGNQYKRKI